MKKVLIHFENLVLKKATKDNWLRQEYIKLIVDWVLNNTFFEITHYDYDKKLKLPSINNLIKEISQKGGLMRFWSELKERDERIDVFFPDKKTNLYSEEISFIMSVPLYKIKSIEQIHRFMWDTILIFKKISLFGPTISASYEGNLNFPRIRPIKQYAFLFEFAIINICDKTYFDNSKFKDDLISKENINKLTQAFRESEELDKTIVDEIIGVTWIKSLKKKDIEDGLSRREDFIQNHIHLAPSQDFTKEGDKRLFSVNNFEKLSSKEYFNFYNEKNGLAFKLIVLDRDMQLSEEDKIQIRKHHKFKSLNDGRKINKIIPVLPERRYVIEVDKIAKEVGIYKSLYLDNDLNIWDITPSGNWKN